MKIFVFEDARYALIHKKWLNDIPEYDCVDVYTIMPPEVLVQIVVDVYTNGHDMIDYKLIQHPFMPLFVDNICNIHDLQKSKIVGRP